MSCQDYTCPSNCCNYYGFCPQDYATSADPYYNSCYYSYP